MKTAPKSNELLRQIESLQSACEHLRIEGVLKNERISELTRELAKLRLQNFPPVHNDYRLMAEYWKGKFEGLYQGWAIVSGKQIPPTSV